MKVFFQGSLSGFVFSLLALWALKYSPWAPMPGLNLAIFLIGGFLLGGFINLLVGNYQNATN